MLHEFIASHREGIIGRAAAMLAQTAVPHLAEVELNHGASVFCDQLIETLRLSPPSNDAMRASAVRHGDEMLRTGFTIGQVVHDYGNVCQTITALASELNVAIDIVEFRTLSRCLDDAIAEAVTEYGRLREQAILADSTERLGVLAHELRNHLGAAMLSFEVLRNGSLAISGGTGALLERSLARLRGLVARSLEEVRLDSAIERFEKISMEHFIAEMAVGAAIEAKARGLQLTVEPVPCDVSIEADRHLLWSAVSHLLQNAFKFTRAPGAVILRVLANAERVSIEVEDRCGGLPPGRADEVLRPLERGRGDRPGPGLGLSITRKVANANRGNLRVHNLPGKGCVFAIDMPRSTVEMT